MIISVRKTQTPYGGWRIFLATSVISLAIVPYTFIKVNELKEKGVTSISGEKPKLKEYARITLKATVAMSGMFIAYFVLFENYPTIATEWAGMPQYLLGLGLLIANIVLTFMFVVFGRLGDIFNKRTLLIISVLLLMAFTPLSVPPIKVLANSDIMLLGTIGYAMFCGYWPIMPTLIVEAVPKEIRGIISSLSYNIGGFVGGITSVIVGMLANIQNLHLWIDALVLFSLFVIFVTMISWPKAQIKG